LKQKFYKDVKILYVPQGFKMDKDGLHQGLHSLSGESFASPKNETMIPQIFSP
jgi:hypothetical protein